MPTSHEIFGVNQTPVTLNLYGGRSNTIDSHFLDPSDMTIIQSSKVIFGAFACEYLFTFPYEFLKYDTVSRHSNLTHT